MLGAIIGDIIGSVYEAENVRTEDFPLFTRFSRFTDDSVLTVATADAIMSRPPMLSYKQHKRRIIDIYRSRLHLYGNRYPHAGYGEMFSAWLSRNTFVRQRSYGNGAAMRVSPVGFAFNSLDEVMAEAALSAMPTHDHAEARKGAQAVASCIFLARTGNDKTAIRAFVDRTFKYNLSRSISELRLTNTFDSSARRSVPQAITIFLESSSFEDALRKAVSIDGDSDTIACMAGGIAQAYYGAIPHMFRTQCSIILDPALWRIVSVFEDHFMKTV